MYVENKYLITSLLITNFFFYNLAQIINNISYNVIVALIKTIFYKKIIKNVNVSSLTVVSPNPFAL